MGWAEIRVGWREKLFYKTNNTLITEATNKKTFC